MSLTYPYRFTYRTSAAQALKALGSGVVPQQIAAALGWLLAVADSLGAAR